MKQDFEFVFEEWVFLAKVDPEAFELRRRRFLEEFIAASGKNELLGNWLQREIDHVRAHAATPAAALCSITGMMCDQLLFLGEELKSLRVQLNRVRELGEAALKIMT